MLIGVFAGIATGALWGLTFVAPLAVAPVSVWDLTVARYEIFGLASVLLMVSPRFRPGPMSAAQAVTGLLLGGLGYTAYVACVFFAVRFAGIAIPPLVIGTTPILLALLANGREATVPWRALALPLGLIGAGLMIVNASALAAADPVDRDAVLRGTLCAFGSLAIWIVYAFINTGVTQGPKAPDTLRWTGIQGIGAALGSLFLLPLTSFRSPSSVVDLLQSPNGGTFLLWALVMGLGGSWLATLCWVVASRRLPLALAGQLIVGETIFGLIYGFLYEGRWPSSAEWVGSLLQLAGVVAAVAIFHRRFGADAATPAHLLRSPVAAAGSEPQ